MQVYWWKDEISSQDLFGIKTKTLKPMLLIKTWGALNLIVDQLHRVIFPLQLI